MTCDAQDHDTEQSLKDCQECNPPERKAILMDRAGFAWKDLRDALEAADKVSK